MGSPLETYAVFVGGNLVTDGIEVQRELKVLEREDEVTDSEGIKLPKLSKIEYFRYTSSKQSRVK